MVTLYRKLFFTFCFLMFSFLAPAQEGKDGALTISTSKIVNEYTYLTASAATGTSTLNVNNSTMNANGRFSGNLVAGDLLLIIQAQGATIDNSNTAAYGSITAYNNAGAYQYAVVKAVSAGKIDIDCTMQKTYSSGGKTLVVRVPRYSSLNITSSGIITADPWDGNTGGIVAVEVSGNIVVNGKIDVTGLGFRGGGYDNSAYNNWALYDQFITSDANVGAEKGESIAGYQTEYDALGGRYGRGAPANGGGGGNCHNAGGGGGANAGDVAVWNGLGNPDIAHPDYIQAWNLEASNFANNVSSGGGRGGYSYGKLKFDPTTVPPGDNKWDGDFRKNVGGYGGRPLNNATSSLAFFGGGGGAGDANNSAIDTSGGDGGGMVFILAKGNVNGSGLILADGGNGGSTPLAGTRNDGTGGGGGGGSIVINAAGLISDLNLQANGGKGGNQYIGNVVTPVKKRDESEGVGGGGGGGFIALTNNLVSSSVLGGKNGISTSLSLTKFPQNGATKGGDGATKIILNTFDDITVEHDTVCSGQTANLKAWKTGGNGNNIEWFSTPAGGASFFIGETYSFTASANVCYYVRLCPNLFRDTVCVNTSSGGGLDLGPDVSICTGDSVQLDAGLWTSYLWKPTGETTQKITVKTAGKYVVEVVSGTCSAKDSITVSMAVIPVDILPDDMTVCAGNSFQLDAGPWTSYLWSPDGETSREITVTHSGKYIVEVSSGSCSGKDSTMVYWNPLPSFTVSSDTVCEGKQATLFVSIDPGNWIIEWQAGGTGSSKVVSTFGEYIVKVTNANTVCAALNSGFLVKAPDLIFSLGNDTTFCEGEKVVLKAPDNEWIKTWPDLSNGDSLIVGTPGPYYLVVEDSMGCKGRDDIVVLEIPAPVFDLGKNISLCEGEEIVLSTNVIADDYFWSNEDTTNSITINQQGKYWLTLTNQPNCQHNDTVNVVFSSIPKMQVTPDTAICFFALDGIFSISAENNFNYQYLWNTGETTAAIVIRKEGKYSVKVTVPGSPCPANKEIKIDDYCPPYIYFPNAFTPNEDGHNETFPTPNQYLKSYHLMIFNRWGELLFDTRNNGEGWDGRYKGNPVQEDVYVWKVDYDVENENGFVVKKLRIGSVVLLR